MIAWQWRQYCLLILTRVDRGVLERTLISCSKKTEPHIETDVGDDWVGVPLVKRESTKDGEVGMG